MLQNDDNYVGRAYNVQDVAVRVKHARLAAGLTQSELASRARVSRDWVIRLEQGTHRNLRIGGLFQVLDALGLVITFIHEPTDYSILDHVRSFTSGNAAAKGSR